MLLYVEMVAVWKKACGGVVVGCGGGVVVCVCVFVMVHMIIVCSIRGCLMISGSVTSRQSKKPSISCYNRKWNNIWRVGSIQSLTVLPK